MNWNIIILIIGVVVAIAVFLFGQGILRKTRRSKAYIFCGIEAIKVPIPFSLRDEMKDLSRNYGAFWVYNIFIRNHSNEACLNPVINIDLFVDIVGHIVNDTNEDRRDVEQSIETPERGHVILKPKRLGPNSFVDVTVWGTGLLAPLEAKTVSFASNGSFILRTKSISYSTNKEKFE